MCRRSNEVVNFIKGPNEEKFRKINLENNAFKNRVDSVLGGRSLLKEFGFKENGSFLEIDLTWEDFDMKFFLEMADLL